MAPQPLGRRVAFWLAVAAVSTVYLFVYTAMVTGVVQGIMGKP